MRSNSVLGIIVMAAMLPSARAVPANPQATARNPQYRKTKTVSFSLRNDMKTEMKVKVGESGVILYPGKALAVKLATGQKVVSAEANPHYPLGTVLAVAGEQLSEATVVLH